MHQTGRRIFVRPSDVYRKAAPVFRQGLFWEFFLILVFTALFAVTVGLGSLASVWLAVFLCIVWLALCALVAYLYWKKIGWRIEAGYLGVMMMRITENRIYQDPVLAARNLAKFRFASYEEYRDARAGTYRSIRQLQNYFERVSDPVGDMPGMGLLVSFGKVLQHLYLRFVRFACIGYSYWCHDMTLFSAIADGVAVYAYNWRRLTKDAAEIVTLEALLIILPATALSFVMIALFRVIGLAAFSFYAVLLSVLLVLVLKRALINPILTAKQMLSYVEDAQKTVLTDKLFLQLSRVSHEYRILLTRAQEEKEPRKKKKRRAPQRVVCPICGTENAPSAAQCVRCGEILTKRR